MAAACSTLQIVCLQHLLHCCRVELKLYMHLLQVLLSSCPISAPLPLSYPSRFSWPSYSWHASSRRLPLSGPLSICLNASTCMLAMSPGVPCTQLGRPMKECVVPDFWGTVLTLIDLAGQCVWGLIHYSSEASLLFVVGNSWAVFPGFDLISCLWCHVGRDDGGCCQWKVIGWELTVTTQGQHVWNQSLKDMHYSHCQQAFEVKRCTTVMHQCHLL